MRGNCRPRARGACQGASWGRGRAGAAGGRAPPRSRCARGCTRPAAAPRAPRSPAQTAAGTCAPAGPNSLYMRRRLPRARRGRAARGAPRVVAQEVGVAPLLVPVAHLRLAARRPGEAAAAAARRRAQPLRHALAAAAAAAAATVAVCGRRRVSRAEDALPRALVLLQPLRRRPAATDTAPGKVSGPGWLEAAAETFAISIWIGALFLTPLSILVSVCYMPHWAAVLWLVLLVRSRRARRGRLPLHGRRLPSCRQGCRQRPARLRGARPPRSSSPWTRPAGRRRSRATRWPSA